MSKRLRYYAGSDIPKELWINGKPYKTIKKIPEIMEAIEKDCLK